jgi:hypothetical protein
VTYHYPGADHDPAKDVYAAFDLNDPNSAEWGQHWGVDLLAPAAGVGSVYQFPTPLSPRVGLAPRVWTGSGGVEGYTVEDYDEYLSNHAALFADVLTPGACFYPGKLGTQQMMVALLKFDTPQRLSNGQVVKAIWNAHCHPNPTVGRIEKGQRWCTSWNSGINFEADNIPALASHCHLAGTVSGNLTLNGEVNGFLVAELLGWDIRDAGVGPGPNEYMSGQYRAGKHVSQWTGHTLPPAPPAS